MKDYYEQYWTRDTDVSDNDVTTPERKRHLLVALDRQCQHGDAVLDFGCGGGGKFAAWLQVAGYDAMGVDISQNAIDMARRNNPDGNYQLLNDDGTIPADDETFSAVWCSEVLEHVLEVDAFLAEIARVLKPGGVLILTTPYHGLLKNLLIALFKFDRHFDPQGSHIRFFDKRSLVSAFSRTGFEPISFSGIGRLWPLYRTWFVLARNGGVT